MWQHPSCKTPLSVPCPQHQALGRLLDHGSDQRLSLCSESIADKETMEERSRAWTAPNTHRRLASKSASYPSLCPVPSCEHASEGPSLVG
eukprot:5649800-Pyramimonas_sp.AAC.1